MSTDYAAMDVDRLQAELAALRAGADSAADSAFADAAMALSAKLAEAGQPERALAVADEGVDHLRRLHGEQPAAWAVHLASALNNLSNRLSDLARDEDGRRAGDEALELAQSALETQPAEARFVVVSTLMNQSGRSWRGGQSLRAIEELGTAVDVFRDGGEALYSFLEFMVDVLHRNALALAEGGLWEEAIAVRRMGTKLFPEDQAPLALLHLLAMTMQQAAFAKSREGYFGEALPLAEDAADIARDLATTEPQQYRLFLAQSLAGLASRQHEAQAHEQALEAAVEAVGVFQDLAKQDPLAALEPLVPTLQTFASILTVLGHGAQAQTILAEREKLMAALDQMKGQA